MIEITLLQLALLVFGSSLLGTLAGVFFACRLFTAPEPGS